jgi:hypothetical protein
MSEPGTQPGSRAQRPGKSRNRPPKAGRLTVSEATSDRAGAGSPFGDDLAFPLPPQQLTYEHPSRD